MKMIGILYMLICLCLSCLVVMVTASVYNDTCSTHFPWKPTWLPHRDDLYCDIVCKDKTMLINIMSSGNITVLDECCRCRSCTSMSNEVVDLDLEYIFVTGKSLVFPQFRSNGSSFYRIRHTYGYMTAIPSNLCDLDHNAEEIARYSSLLKRTEPFFNKIAFMQFDYNSIRELSDLNCLQRLDTLTLKGNRITHVSNTSLANLTFLRILDLSENLIKAMDPGVLISPHLSIQQADFSSNSLAQLEVTNMCILRPFCNIEYNNNKITDLINTVGFVFKDTHSGPGMVGLTNNLIEEFPDVTSLLGLDNLTQFGQFAGWGFDLREIKLNCDCNIAPFVSLGENLRKQIWKDYFNVKCESHQELRGQVVFNVDPINFVCKLDRRNNCNQNCTCIDQPILNTLYVDCSNKGFHSLPEFVPTSNFSDNIVLNMSGNILTNVVNRTYLKNVAVLDLSSNILEHIEDDVAQLLENATFNISDNYRLRHFPQQFQYRNICDIAMENIVLDCDCDLIWIEMWIQTKSSTTCKPLFSCDVPGTGHMPANKFTHSMLSCTQDTTRLKIVMGVIAAIILLSTFIAMLVYNFWYEIIIIWTIFKQTSLKKHVASFEHDVIISLNEEDDHLRDWVKDTVLPVLNIYEYRAFLPYRDIVWGSDRDREISDTISNTRTFLLVLSESYLIEPEDSTNDRSWTENEWKYGWHRFLADPDHNLVIVNYDYVSPSAVRHPQIRAFLRVGHVVDFDNFDKEVMTNIRRKIGAPNLDKTDIIRGETNSNVRFNVPPEMKHEKPEQCGHTRHRGQVDKKVKQGATAKDGSIADTKYMEAMKEAMNEHNHGMTSPSRVMLSLKGRVSKVAPLPPLGPDKLHSNHRHHACFD